MAYVARREHALYVRFQEIWLPVECPIVRGLASLHQVRAGDEIARIVADNANFRRPLCVRDSAEAEEDPSGLLGALLASAVVAQGDGAQHLVAVQRRDLGIEQHLDVGRGADAVDQVLR